MSSGLLQVFVELGNLHGLKFSIKTRMVRAKLFDDGVIVKLTAIRRWFPKLRRQSSGGCRFNPDCRRVTIPEYLTLVPGYG